IKRGAYAWEASLNAMSSERSVITIDGMRIYSACTDKMDPITSYVEVSNLQEAKVSSGQSGGEHGACTSGSIDLIQKKLPVEERLSFEFMSGGESNNQQKIIGTDAEFARGNFSLKANFMYRDAENYSAGKGEEVLYSGFTKYNAAVTSGFKLNEQESLEAAIIYDLAEDVGYPALPMDVSKAEAIIASFTFKRKQLTEAWKNWETKLYYNTIEHIMDDSNRPDVPIRMEMPGYSKTLGFYTKSERKWNENLLKVNLSGHFNNSLAEMTMISNNPLEPDMFMLTWPDVDTAVSGVFTSYKQKLNQQFSLDYNLGFYLNNHRIKDALGLESLRIFYPEMQATKTRILYNASITFQHQKNAWKQGLTLATGTRAPSVSEAFGFYLYNSFDGFDYIGNPNLPNEQSVEAAYSLEYKFKTLRITANSNHFLIYDYIIGKPNASIGAMTIGAFGVKTYTPLTYARIWNNSLKIDYQFTKTWGLSSRLRYSIGEDKQGEYLPLIPPLNYDIVLNYHLPTLQLSLVVEGAADQSRFNPDFGENKTDAYTVAHLNISKSFRWEKKELQLSGGVQNMFDTYYSTFADWNNIPRMGRNFFVNLSFEL
ncbi:MAG: TonB-dependent receptor, partial [Flavobacteriaceae bacterium]|nr:TonB-dependent receptor [Flavobacteriaceae bacterium]